MSVIDELKELAKGIIKESKETLETMDEMSEWDSIAEVIANVKTAQKFFGDVSIAIKQAAATLGDTVSNEEKLDAAIAAIMDLVEWPAMVEFGLSMFLKYAVSAAYHQYGEEA